MIVTGLRLKLKSPAHVNRSAQVGASEDKPGLLATDRAALTETAT